MGLRPYIGSDPPFTPCRSLNDRASQVSLCRSLLVCSGFHTLRYIYCILRVILADLIVWIILKCHSYACSSSGYLSLPAWTLGTRCSVNPLPAANAAPSGTAPAAAPGVPGGSRVCKDSFAHRCSRHSPKAQQCSQKRVTTTMATRKTS